MQPGEHTEVKLSLQQVIGRLLHLALFTRPDNALPVGGACGIFFGPWAGSL
jgi:hypothetical protein